MFLLFKAIIYLPSGKSVNSFSDIALRILTRTCLLTHHPHCRTSFLTNSKPNISKTAWINPLSGFYPRIFPLLKVNARMLSQGTKIIFRKVFCFPTKKIDHLRWSGNHSAASLTLCFYNLIFIVQ